MPRTTRLPTLAQRADRRRLYEQAVQEVAAEIDFVDDAYRAIRGRRATRLREDFCGTGNTSCEWVRRRPANTAVGLDIDEETLAWGRARHVARLKPAARERIRLLNSNVLHPPTAARAVDIVLAMNFSYSVFHERPLMLGLHHVQPQPRTGQPLTDRPPVEIVTPHA